MVTAAVVAAGQCTVQPLTGAAVDFQEAVQCAQNGNHLLRIQCMPVPATAPRDNLVPPDRPCAIGRPGESADHSNADSARRLHEASSMQQQCAGETLTVAPSLTESVPTIPPPPTAWQVPGVQQLRYAQPYSAWPEDDRNDVPMEPPAPDGGSVGEAMDTRPQQSCETPASCPLPMDRSLLLELATRLNSMGAQAAQLSALLTQLLASHPSAMSPQSGPAGSHSVQPLSECTEAGPAQRQADRYSPQQRSKPLSHETLADLDMAVIKTYELKNGPRVQPDSLVLQQWLVRNTGRARWPDGTRLQFIAGSVYPSDAISWRRTVPLAPNATTILSVQLRTPSTPGPHSCTWQLMTDRGCTVGVPVQCHVIVDDLQHASAVPHSATASVVPTPVSAAAARMPATSTAREVDARVFSAAPLVSSTASAAYAPTASFRILSPSMPAGAVAPDGSLSAPHDPLAPQQRSPQRIKSEGIDRFPSAADGSRPGDNDEWGRRSDDDASVRLPIFGSGEPASLPERELLMRLEEIGFTDMARNMALLRRHRYDLTEAILELTNT